MANENPIFLSLGKQISQVPSSLVMEQDIYQKGLVRFNETKTGLVNTITGEVYNTLNDAIEKTNKFGINELNILTGQKPFPGVDLDGFAPLSDLVSNINEYLKLGDPEAVDFRSKSPLLTSLEGKNLQLVRQVYSETSSDTLGLFSKLYDKVTYGDIDQTTEGPLVEQLRSGTIDVPGYLATRDNQSVLLRFRYETADGFKYLKGEETIELLNLLDAQFFNVDRLAGILNPLNADGTPNLSKNVETAFGAQLSKSAKRKWQSLVERNMVINQEGVENIVNLISRGVDKNLYNVPKSLQESFLFFDASLEKTLKAFDLETNYSNQLLGSAGSKESAKEVRRTRDATRLVMSRETKQSAQQYFRSALELQGLSGDSEFNEFENVIRSQYAKTMKEKSGKKISLEDIISGIKKTVDEGSLTESVQLKYKNYITALSEMKKIDDGSGFITSAPFRQHAQNLKNSIIEARNMLEAPGIAGTSQEEDIIGYISKMKTQLDKIVTNSEDYLKGSNIALREFKHDTARLFIGKGQGKSVFDLVQGVFARQLEKLGFIGAGSEELYKKEISFARFNAPGSSSLSAGENVGQQITMNITTGHGRDLVYSEPQAMIFHQGQYGQNFYDQTSENAKYLELEIENIMKKGRISQRLKRSIQNDANLDIEGMDIETLTERFGNKQSAIRIREAARSLQEHLARGIKVYEIPDLANKLLDQAFREVRREKGTYRSFVAGKVQDQKVFNYSMPYALRQAIDTEGAMSKRGVNQVLGVTDDTTFSRFTSEFGDELSLFKFRHVGHKMLVPDIASTSLGLYEAGGGFDLDDKWITNLQSIKNSQGVRKLAAFAWRQPTGPQEFALVSPYLDEDTLMRMFGDETLMGQKFRNVSAAVSDMIDTRKNFVTGLTTDLNQQIDARQLEQLTKEEKIYKYLNALAHNNEKIAKQFKGSVGDITQEDLEKAIFNLVDLNGKSVDDVDLFGDGVRVNVDAFANDYMDANNKGVESVQYKYFNIAETDSSIVKKAASTKVGTMLALNPDEIRKLDGDILTSYRQSSLTQIMNTTSTLESDQLFIKAISDLEGSQLTQDSTMGDALRQAGRLLQTGR